jgi:hypothetical protein
VSQRMLLAVDVRRKASTSNLQRHHLFADDLDVTNFNSLGSTTTSAPSASLKLYLCAVCR